MDGMLLALCDHGFERSGLCAVNNNNNRDKHSGISNQNKESFLLKPKYNHTVPLCKKIGETIEWSWCTFCKKIQGTDDIRHDSSE